MISTLSGMLQGCGWHALKLLYNLYEINSSHNIKDEDVSLEMTHLLKINPQKIGNSLSLKTPTPLGCSVPLWHISVLLPLDCTSFTVWGACLQQLFSTKFLHLQESRAGFGSANQWFTSLIWRHNICYLDLWVMKVTIISCLQNRNSSTISLSLAPFVLGRCTIRICPAELILAKLRLK